ncbi:MAG TPA: EAL domain-containing protein [Gaiellales bacterium]|nr:EAL domain-containing protein [Gaiellales bacterium]
MPRESNTDAIDVLRRVAGTTAVHIYEMEWLDDGSYRCNQFIGAGLESLLGPIPAGMDEEEAWEAAVHPDDRAAYDACADAQRRGEQQEIEYRLNGFDGVTRWVWERARPRFEDGRMLVDGIVADVTDRRRAGEELAEAQAKLAHLAYHDPLTDLPNRLLFQEHLEQAVERARRGSRGVAVLFVDLDDFKLVNDSFGHSVGDELLRAVAGRLREVTRADDVVARLGGDEFLVLISDIRPVETAAAADRVAEKIRAALQAPVRLPEGELHTGASIGVSLYPTDAADAGELMKHADIAMYRAKQAGRGAQRPIVASSVDAADQLATASRLRHALERDQLVLHYQPLMALDSGVMVGVEALVRWRDGRRGLVGPSAFIPLAERVGLIGPISDWVVETACAQMRLWQTAGIDLYVSVNMPPFMWRPAAMRKVLHTMDSVGLSAERLMFEITESAAIAEPGHLEPIMAELHARGLRVAIDDFGTGHSSLERLSQMRVTTLKIDRSFVAALPGDGRTAVLVATIIQLARNLGLEPLAEGVETNAQRRFLVEHGCRLGQGFYFSRAVPAERIERLYRDAQRRAAA